MKLATELSKVATGRTLYILDEPTTGLHFADVQRLLEVLQRLVDAGNSVVVIEHNLDVIKCADRLIDMGPEGGEEGGMAIAVGTPEEVAAEPASHTGPVPRRDPHARRAGASDAEPGKGAAAQTPGEGRRVSRPARRGGLPGRSAGELARQARLWAQKWRWYERNSLPWNRARIHWEFMRREAFVRWPVHGNVLEALREGRLRDRRGHAARAGRVDHRPGRRARAHRRGHVPEPGRDGGRAGAGRDRRPLHARQRLLRLGRQPPLRRSASSRSPGRGSRARGRRASATTAGWGRTWWSRAA